MIKRRSTESFLFYRVQLDRVTSSNIVPTNITETEDQNGEIHSMANDIQKDSEEIVIAWQQKIFSQVTCFIDFD